MVSTRKTSGSKSGTVRRGTKRAIKEEEFTSVTVESGEILSSTAIADAFDVAERVEDTSINSRPVEESAFSNALFAQGNENLLIQPGVLDKNEQSDNTLETSELSLAAATLFQSHIDLPPQFAPSAFMPAQNDTYSGLELGIVFQEPELPILSITRDFTSGDKGFGKGNDSKNGESNTRDAEIGRIEQDLTELLHRKDLKDFDTHDDGRQLGKRSHTQRKNRLDNYESAAENESSYGEFVDSDGEISFQETEKKSAKASVFKGNGRKTIDEVDDDLTTKDQNLVDEEEFGSEDELDEKGSSRRRRRRRGGRRTWRATEQEEEFLSAPLEEEEELHYSSKRTRRRTRERMQNSGISTDEVTAPKGSTRLEAKRQRRREGREAGRRRYSITESEFLARRENVKREMLVREQNGLNQIAVLEDGMLVEHYVARHSQKTAVGNVYLGRVQNVLPSMEAAFVDIGRGRNAVLYAGEVNWDATGLDGKSQRIEQAISVGDKVLVQVTKDPIGQKGARLTSQITLAGRHLVLVPNGAMTGISRKLPERERSRLKRILRQVVPDNVGVIVRTAAEGASEEQLRLDVERLLRRWNDIKDKADKSRTAPVLLKSEPELALRVVRDQFNEDFESLTISGKNAWQTIHDYLEEVSPDLVPRMHNWTNATDIFSAHRIDEQLAKGMDRKVWLPSGGSLVIDRTEAMTVIDVNTGRFVGSGGTLEETVTRNNLEAAEEIVRQLRLRDIGGIIVIDFIDMVLEANRELVLRRLVECLSRDRTRHQVAEVTSLGLVQMTRKRVGQGLVEAFSTPCEHCEGRGFLTHSHPIERRDDDLVSGEASLTGGSYNDSSRFISRPSGGTTDTSGSLPIASSSEYSKNTESAENRKSSDAKDSKSFVAKTCSDEVALQAAQAARVAIKETIATIAAAAKEANQAKRSDSEMKSTTVDKEADNARDKTDGKANSSRSAQINNNEDIPKYFESGETDSGVELTPGEPAPAEKVNEPETTEIETTPKRRGRGGRRRVVTTGILTPGK